MSALIDYIQKEIHITYKKRYSKKYIENKLVPIINLSSLDLRVLANLPLANC